MEDKDRQGIHSGAEGKYRDPLANALDAIDEMIGDAIDKKIRSGKLPPIGALLSTIQDTASHALEDYRAESKSTGE